MACSISDIATETSGIASSTIWSYRTAASAPGKHHCPIACSRSRRSNVCILARCRLRNACSLRCRQTSSCSSSGGQKPHANSWPKDCDASAHSTRKPLVLLVYQLHHQGNRFAQFVHFHRSAVVYRYENLIVVLRLYFIRMLTFENLLFQKLPFAVAEIRLMYSSAVNVCWFTSFPIS